MAKETTHAGMLGDWQRLLEPLTGNAADLAHLEGSRAKFAALVTQANAIVREKAAHRAAKQELSRQLQVLLGEGQRLATLLRVGIKEHYGPRSEKLTEFGLQPFRGRKAKAAPEEPSPSTPLELIEPTPSHP